MADEINNEISEIILLDTDNILNSDTDSDQGDSAAGAPTATSTSPAIVDVTVLPDSHEHKEDVIATESLDDNADNANAKSAKVSAQAPAQTSSASAEHRPSSPHAEQPAEAHTPLESQSYPTARTE